MAESRGAGKMRDRLHFQRRAKVKDGYGNHQAGDFATIFTAWARLIPLRGTEAVMASRLAGVQPYVIQIRSSNDSRAVDPSWRIVDVRDEKRVFDITAIVDPDGKRQWLDVTATLGAAT